VLVRFSNHVCQGIPLISRPLLKKHPEGGLEACVIAAISHGGATVSVFGTVSRVVSLRIVRHY
jgi:hypothetical protein